MQNGECERDQEEVEHKYAWCSVSRYRAAKCKFWHSSPNEEARLLGSIIKWFDDVDEGEIAVPNTHWRKRCGRRQPESAAFSVGRCFRGCWSLPQVQKRGESKCALELVSRRSRHVFQVQRRGRRGLVRVDCLAHLIREDLCVMWPFLIVRRWPRGVSWLVIGQRKIPPNLLPYIHPSHVNSGSGTQLEVPSLQEGTKASSFRRLGIMSLRQILRSFHVELCNRNFMATRDCRWGVK